LVENARKLRWTLIFSQKSSQEPINRARFDEAALLPQPFTAKVEFTGGPSFQGTPTLRENVTERLAAALTKIKKALHVLSTEWPNAEKSLNLFSHDDTRILLNDGTRYFYMERFNRILTHVTASGTGNRLKIRFFDNPDGNDAQVPYFGPRSDSDTIYVNTAIWKDFSPEQKATTLAHELARLVGIHGNGSQYAGTVGCVQHWDGVIAELSFLYDNPVYLKDPNKRMGKK
jgi:hypothetical protein